MQDRERLAHVRRRPSGVVAIERRRCGDRLAPPGYEHAVEMARVADAETVLPELNPVLLLRVGTKTAS